MKKLIASLAMFVALGAHADPLKPFNLIENFDSGLGVFSAVNASSAPTGAAWFPGNSGVFSSHGGAPGAYAASNFLVSGSGSIQAWLISPELTFIGQSVSFFARIEDATFGFLEGLTLLVSTSGSSTNLADFSPLLTIGPGALTDVWTQYSALLGTIGTGRIAFLYGVGNVDDANYIGLDSIVVQGTPVPEPAALALVGLGLGLIVAMRRRRGGRI